MVGQLSVGYRKYICEIISHYEWKSVSLVGIWLWQLMARTFVFHLLRFLLAKFPFMANFPFREYSCCCLLFAACCLLFTVRCLPLHLILALVFAFTLHLATLSGSDGLLKWARFDKCVSLLAGTIKEAIDRWFVWFWFLLYTPTIDGTDVNGKTWLKWTACGTRWDARSVQYNAYKRWIGKQLNAYLSRENPKTQLV